MATDPIPTIENVLNTVDKLAPLVETVVPEVSVVVSLEPLAIELLNVIEQLKTSHSTVDAWKLAGTGLVNLGQMLQQATTSVVAAQVVASVAAQPRPAEGQTAG